MMMVPTVGIGLFRWINNTHFDTRERWTANRCCRKLVDWGKSSRVIFMTREEIFVCDLMFRFVHLVCVECMQHHPENGGQQGLGMVCGCHHLVGGWGNPTLVFERLLWGEDLLHDGECVQDNHGNLSCQVAFNVWLQLWVPIWRDII